MKFEFRQLFLWPRRRCRVTFLILTLVLGHFFSLAFAIEKKPIKTVAAENMRAKKSVPTPQLKLAPLAQPAPEYSHFSFLEQNESALGEGLSDSVRHLLKLLKWGTFDRDLAERIYQSISPKLKSSIIDEIPDGNYLVESYKEKEHPRDSSKPRGIIAQIIHIDRKNFSYNGIPHNHTEEWVYIPDPDIKVMYQIPLGIGGGSETANTHQLSIRNENLIHQIGYWRMESNPRTQFDMAYLRSKSRNEEEFQQKLFFEAVKRHFYRMSAMDRFETLEIEWWNKFYKKAQIQDPENGSIPFQLNDPRSGSTSLWDYGRYIVVNGENRESPDSRVFESEGLNAELYRDIKLGDFTYVPYKPVLDLQNIYVFGNEADLRITVILLPKNHSERLEQVQQEEQRSSRNGNFVYTKYGHLVEFNPLDPLNTMTVRDVGYDSMNRLYFAEFEGLGSKKFILNEGRQIERDFRVGRHMLGQYMSTSGLQFILEKNARAEAPFTPIEMKSLNGDVSKVVDQVLAEITPNKNPDNFRFPSEYLKELSPSRGRVALNIRSTPVELAKEDTAGKKNGASSPAPTHRKALPSPRPQPQGKTCKGVFALGG